MTAHLSTRNRFRDVDDPPALGYKKTIVGLNVGLDWNAAQKLLISN